MSEPNLDTILAALDTRRQYIEAGRQPSVVAYLTDRLIGDVPALVAEVRRLRAEVDDLRMQAYAQKPVVDAAQAWAEAHEDNDLVRRIRRPSAHPAVAGLYDAVEQYRLMDLALTSAREEQAVAR